MSQYTLKEVEEAARDLRNKQTGEYGYVDSAMDQGADILDAYATTLRQAPAQGGVTEAMQARFKANERNERRRSIAEVDYWRDQWRLLARDAIAALSAQQQGQGEAERAALPPVVLTIEDLEAMQSAFWNVAKAPRDMLTRRIEAAAFALRDRLSERLTAPPAQPAERVKLSQETPLPWSYRRLDRHFAIEASNGVRVAEVRFVARPDGTTSEAQAKVIVDAVNAATSPAERVPLRTPEAARFQAQFDDGDEE